MGDQNFTAWFTDYPDTHVKAGQTVEVVPRALYEAALMAGPALADGQLPVREQYRGPRQPVEITIPAPPAPRERQAGDA